MEQLHQQGLEWNSLMPICKGLTASEITNMLQKDFQIQPPLVANQLRAVILYALEEDSRTKNTAVENTNPDHLISPSSKAERPLYKASVVNQAAVQRKLCRTVGAGNYGLPQNCGRYKKLASELNAFVNFMTRPSTTAQEDPIRPATAEVYERHARLFLGWCVSVHNATTPPASISLWDIIPNADKDSATLIINFVMWLRSDRNSSVRYEANVLRGLNKLLKFRFANESQSDPMYGDKAFHDIPMIREIRKLHRTANQQGKLAPASSDESTKWLTWPEYLQVVQLCKQDLEQLLQNYTISSTAFAVGKEEVPVIATDKITAKQRKIAIAFQKFLVLSLFTNIPDRQRTVRECELGKSFVKDDKTNLWCIRHAPNDYKTGKTYGDRPPMLLSRDLSESMDVFVTTWRACLQPKTNMLFCQQRTGNSLTKDSVYAIVSRACYEKMGRKTNPHLLRDMLVTHVRETNASEKELEALALFMGHSIQMQRSSYDRRTLERKVAPAIELLQAVNSMDTTV
jgi:hypothetical protein